MKVFIWLMGGLGNNLFQLNYGFYLRDVKGVDVTFVDYLTRRNILTKTMGWKIHPQIVKELFPSVYLESCGSFATPALARTSLCKAYCKYVGVKQEMGGLTRNLFGYFQFGKEQIPLSSELVVPYDYNVIRFVDQFDVTVHMRFRDNNWMQSSLEFYSDSLKKFSEDRVLICTDDKAMAQRLAIENSLVDFYISQGSPLDDFKALVFSKNICLSPSSFSWWACSLNRRKSKVLYPEFMIDEFGEFF